MASVKNKVNTRISSQNKMTLYFGPPKVMDLSEVPTARAVIQNCNLIKENMILLEEVPVNQVTKLVVAKEVALHLMSQWTKSNAKFVHPVIIKEESIVKKIERLYQNAENVVSQPEALLYPFTYDDPNLSVMHLCYAILFR